MSSTRLFWGHFTKLKYFKNSILRSTMDHKRTYGNYSGQSGTGNNPYSGEWYKDDNPPQKSQVYSRGGRRGGRGGRRGGYGRARRSNMDDNGEWKQRSAGRGRGRGGHPSGLKGRDIGLWYAQRGKERRLEKEMHNRKTIHMDEQQIGQVNHALSDARFQSKKQEIPDSKVSGSSHEADFGCIENESPENVSDFLPFSDNDKSWFSTPLRLGADLTINKTLKDELAEKVNDSHYIGMQKFRKTLPAFKKRIDLMKLINSNQVIVISGETGCGKTTQVPQFILDDAIENNNGMACKIVCTQPRRISAISVAERVADERSERCGEISSCGYQIRLDSKLPRSSASILYCTTGILIQCLKSDPLLQNISHIVLDEIHERDLQTDFLITIVKNIVETRNDLKVILMSATLNAELFSSYFDNCPCFHIPGFTFPVQSLFLEEIMDVTKYDPPDAAYRLIDDVERFNNGQMKRREAEKFSKKNIDRDIAKKWREYEKTELSSRFPEWACDKLYAMHLYTQSGIDPQLIVATIKYIVNEQPRGAILVFVPGWMDIKAVHDQLQRDRQFSPSRFLIIPLHSMMPTANQRQVFDRPPPGVTKIVIATNIAETSITIDDVVHVIDSGKIKLTDFDHMTNIASLQMRWVSRANAKQRNGRAGRVQEGFCYHLYTKLQEQDFSDFLLPEMLRTPLDQLCLQIRVLELGKIEVFLSKVMEPPPSEGIELSIQKLIALSAMDVDQRLMPLGYHLARLPVEPQIGKMILMGAIFSCLDPVLTIAANLSFKDPFVVPLGKEREADRRKKDIADGTNSDHLMLLNAYQGWESSVREGHREESQYCWDNFLSKSTLGMLRDMKGQFAQQLHSIGFCSSPSPKDPIMNKLSNNKKVVLAVVCSGLYPNIAKINFSKPYKPVKIITKSEKVNFHPKSVNYEACGEKFSERWLCYYLKMKTSVIYLFDTSEVTAYPLLFFGGNISAYYDLKMKGDVIAVDDWIVFKSKPNIAKLVKDLRIALDDILEKKIRDPDITVLTNNDTASKVLSSIVDLITTE
uniref:ATP-dependent DNA/RNA helicase DHX36-like n=1 Tax=Styela clava TaxID=7725 RepID=UPI001939C393|nr:ATP-dependent DNA/RNA helicase DHX36-like [Styela clava]